MKVIILAGGLGTRLKDIVNDKPKVMADLNGVPFLYKLLNNLSNYNVTEFIICVSYLKEKIINFFGNEFKGIPIKYSIEKKPLGTGGAIKQALKIFNIDKAIVVNGDTFVKIDYNSFYKKFKNTQITLLLIHKKNISRYGSVNIIGNLIVKFNEKQNSIKSGLINAGVYFIRKDIFNILGNKKVFSFEKDFLEKYVSILNIKYFITNDYFIDIGTKKSYFEAKKQL